jgi:hypothetical protein
MKMKKKLPNLEQKKTRIDSKYFRLLVEKKNKLMKNTCNFYIVLLFHTSTV